MDLQGPLFLQEPPHRVEFSNSSGGRIDCTAHGSPTPEVEWILADGSSVRQVYEVVFQVIKIIVTKTKINKMVVDSFLF